MVRGMTKAHSESLAIFSLDGQSLALAVASVDTVVQAVEIAPLPGAPAGVRGIINVHGEVIPVFDLRVRFGAAERPLRLTDHLVIARTSRRKVALVVDAAIEVVNADEMRIVGAGEILPEFGAIEGVMKLAGDIVLIHDLDRFLSLEAEHELAAALGA